MIILEIVKHSGQYLKLKQFMKLNQNIDKKAWKNITLQTHVNYLNVSDIFPEKFRGAWWAGNDCNEADNQKMPLPVQPEKHHHSFEEASQQPPGWTQEVVSTTHLMNSVSSLQYPCLGEHSLPRGQKEGQPLARFISVIGLWKELEDRSGLKASIMCSLWFWSSRKKVTWKTHRSDMVTFGQVEDGLLTA